MTVTVAPDVPLDNQRHTTTYYYLVPWYWYGTVCGTGKTQGKVLGDGTKELR